MQTIETCFGTLYVTEPKDIVTGDIRLYDSTKYYFDSFPVDSISVDETVGEFVDGLVKDISALPSVDSLLDYLGINAEVTEDWRDLVKFLWKDDATMVGDDWVELDSGKLILEDDLMGSGWVNKIGKTYIYVAPYDAY